MCIRLYWPRRFFSLVKRMIKRITSPDATSIIHVQHSAKRQLRTRTLKTAMRASGKTVTVYHPRNGPYFRANEPFYR